MTRNHIIVSILLFLCLLSGCISQRTENNVSSQESSQNPIVSNTSEQESFHFESGYTFSDYNYKIQNDYIKIERYIGSDINVIIPNQIEGKPVKILGDDSFFQRTDIKEVILPESLSTIGSDAFYRCYSLKEIFIPKNVEKIGDNPFFKCSNLSKIVVDPENRNYCDVDGALLNKDKNTLLAYPEGKSEEKCVIPDTVTTIADCAFGYRCNFSEIYIGKNVVNFPSNDMFFNNPEMKLLVKPNSAAEQYAKEYGLDFEIVK